MSHSVLSLPIVANALGWASGGAIGLSAAWRVVDWHTGVVQYAASGFPAYVYPAITLAQAAAAFGLITGYGRILAGVTFVGVVSAATGSRVLTSGLFQSYDWSVLLIVVVAASAAAAQSAVSLTKR